MTLPSFITRSLAGRSARERQMLATAGLVVAVALLFALTEWTLAERHRLDRALPTARAQLERMQAQADELARLRGATAPALPTPAVQVEVLRSAANSRGLAIEVKAAEGGIEATGHGGLSALLDWLASVEAEQRLYPARLALAPADAQGLRIDVLLTPVAAR